MVLLTVTGLQVPVILQGIWQAGTGEVAPVQRSGITFESRAQVWNDRHLVKSCLAH